MLYHCSPTAGIRVLRPSETAWFGKPRQVCLTSLLPMALLYGVRHFEYTYGYTRDGRIYFEEYYEDALGQIYGGQRASLYLCAESADFSATAIPNEYVSNAPVPVLEERPVPDVLAALLEQERLGALKIVRYAEMTAASRERALKAERDTILEQGLLTQDTAFARYMRATYPAAWALAEQEEEGT